MRATKRFPPVGGLALVVGFVLFSGTTYSQVTLLEDDFEGAAIDEAKWRLDAAPFETGAGDFQATQADGQLTIAGTATQNWWPGLALATVPTFTASPEAPLTFEFDRISHDRTDNTATGAGENSSTRTSMWISDASRENYVLYSHNSNEGGWTYNKRVGDPDDNATAGGANIVEFNGEDANFGVHRLKMVADGTTVQLFLDDLEGPVVNFPFTEGIVCRLGSYARRGAGPQPTDSVTGVFDNVLITGASGECVALSPDFTQVLAGEMAELTLQIPAGVARPAAVTVTSSDPAVAIPTGAVAGALNVVFADGDPPFRSLPLDVVGEGIAEFSLTHDLGGCTGDPVRIFVPAVLFEDDFEDGALGRGEWFTNDEPFEDGDGVFDLVEENGTIRLFGTGDRQFWPGIAVMTNATFNATPDLPVTFQIDQTLTSTSQGAFRAGVWAANCERDEFVFFSFIRGTSGDWVVNSSDFDLWPPFGDGTDLAAYNCCGFDALDTPRRVELVANGETVAVVMDGVKGGEAPFLVGDVSFGFGVYALGPGDSVDATFDNARILGDSNTLGVGCEGKLPLTFVRGDADSNGSINLTDGIVILNFLFLGAAAPACLDAADTDDDGGQRPSLTDAVIIFSWLFSGGVPPAAPSPDAPNYVAENCGPDVTDDGMDCAVLSPVCQ